MKVIVDYYNVYYEYKTGGIEKIENDITQIIHEESEKSVDRIEYRLYGGWYEGRKITRDAQNLITETGRCYPKVRSPVGSEAKLKVNVQLAYSVLGDSEKNLIRTVRKKDQYKKINANSPKTYGCSRDDCYLKGIAGFFRNGYCTYDGCSIDSNEIIGSEREQKLIDTMMTSDIIYAGLISEDPVCVVSSDDDMVPAIRNLLSVGGEVIHIHTGARIKTPSYYIKKDTNKYNQSATK